ncbi:MAG: HNH endonuclease [Bacteroidales bacterium]|nr:HNH endonuclease [Bacteroidales bacterium]
MKITRHIIIATASILALELLGAQDSSAQVKIVAKEAMEKTLKKETTETISKTVRHAVSGAATEATERAAKKTVTKNTVKDVSGITMTAAAIFGAEDETLEHIGRQAAAKSVSEKEMAESAMSSLQDAMRKNASSRADRQLSPSEKYRRAKSLNEKYTDPVERQRHYDGLNDEDRALLDQYQSAKYSDSGFAGVPASNGSWTGTRGDSKWKPNRNVRPADKGYSNKDHKTWGEILDENGIDGINFHNGEPDLEPVARLKTTIDYDKDISDKARAELLGDKPNRAAFHDDMFEKMAHENGMTKQELMAYKDQHNLVIHECSDCKTVILVPREIHDNLPHHGGVEMFRKFNGL